MSDFLDSEINLAAKTARILRNITVQNSTRTERSVKMSGYFHKITTDEKVNFLDSEVGLVLKTAQIDDTDVDADEYGYKIVKSGTVYPADDGTATGIVFEDVDVTYGPKAGSLLVAGRVLKDRFDDITEPAVTALSKLGIVFCDRAETERPE